MRRLHRLDDCGGGSQQQKSDWAGLCKRHGHVVETRMVIITRLSHANTISATPKTTKPEP